MADENIVTWNVTNWVTIVLMAAIGLGILGVVQKYIASKKAVQGDTIGESYQLEANQSSSQLVGSFDDAYFGRNRWGTFV